MFATNRVIRHVVIVSVLVIGAAIVPAAAAATGDVVTAADEPQNNHPTESDPVCTSVGPDTTADGTEQSMVQVTEDPTPSPVTNPDNRGLRLTADSQPENPDQGDTGEITAASQRSDATSVDDTGSSEPLTLFQSAGTDGGTESEVGGSKSVDSVDAGAHSVDRVGAAKTTATSPARSHTAGGDDAGRLTSVDFAESGESASSNGIVRVSVSSDLMTFGNYLLVAFTSTLVSLVAVSRSRRLRSRMDALITGGPTTWNEQQWPSDGQDSADSSTVAAAEPPVESGSAGAGAMDVRLSGRGSGSAGGAGDTDATDQLAAGSGEFLSDETVVERLLQSRDGRMKQSAIVEATEWSKAKVSRLLSGMDQDGRIHKLSLGRENLIYLPGEEPAIIEPTHPT